jgi:hypothetical protein
MDENIILAQIDVTKPVLEYSKFRTGLTYYDVYYLVWGRKHKRRNTVLGYWHELKQKMYTHYINLYTMYSDPNYIPF